jgi:hypothetical protein
LAPVGENAPAGVPLLDPDRDTSMFAASILAASVSSALEDCCLMDMADEPERLTGLGVGSSPESASIRADPGPQPYVLVAGILG